MSFDILQARILELENPTVVGLDPLPDYIPGDIVEKHLRQGETPEAMAEAYFEFNCGIIDAVCDIVPAVKPQSAYYELLGYEGVRAFKKTADYAKSKGMYVIADVKRNDIGSTAQAYSEAYLGAVKIGGSEIFPFDFDAATVNAYLGSDGVMPFIETCKKRGKAIFALVKTSNPSSGELQDKVLDGEPVYTVVADLMAEISRDTIGKEGFSCVGAVVGATYPEELKFLRERLANTFFLVPGYGAQGGGAKEVANAFQKGGRGAIINSSRGIICAWKKTGGNFAEAARAEALSMRDMLREVAFK